MTAGASAPPKNARQKPAATGELHIALEVPEGMSRQYFDAAVEYADGSANGGQLSEDGFSLPVTAKNPPIRARLWLPMFELGGDPVRIDPAKGFWLSFRFEPNDIGKVDFHATALKIDKGDLLLDQHGREIRFRRVPGSSSAKAAGSDR